MENIRKFHQNMWAADGAVDCTLQPFSRFAENTITLIKVQSTPGIT